MREHLVFTLCAPMGAFGTYAGHEPRGAQSLYRHALQFSDCWVPHWVSIGWTPTGSWHYGAIALQFAR